MTYTPTRPRGPIAAMYSSPGPIYKLSPLLGYNDHSCNSVYRKNPAFSFGMRTSFDKSDRSPGPCYALPSRLYNTGPDGLPCYSISGRPRDLHIHQTPGPGAYSKESSDAIVYRKGPTYSISGRFASRHSDNVPAPNVYTVPSAIGKTVDKRQMPMYSVAGRSKIGGISEDLAKTPGPGAYSVGIESGCPKYSMTGRNDMPGDTTMKPGPGAYDVSTSYRSVQPTKSYSFGIRHSAYVAPLILSGDND